MNESKTRAAKGRTATKARHDHERRGVLDLPKAVEERLAEGRAERESVALEAHGEWETPDRRPDAVGILEKQNATRVPDPPRADDSFRRSRCPYGSRAVLTPWG
jgi:hypothetical protein